MRDITLSNKTFKLEHDPYSYQLQDTAEPELFREMFPYTETPKIAFNYRRVPENMPEDIFITDTTASLGMIPFDMVKDNVDFCMASAQKGLMAMSGLSFVIGRRSIIEASKNYPTRSYYCNLYMQYECFEKTGEMHFTPPVQTIYATIQALKEYWAEGEEAKWARHTRVFNAINDGLDALGFRQVIKPEWRTGLVSSAIRPFW